MQGLRRAVAIAVGEKHSIALQGFWVPRLPTELDARALAEGGAQARAQLSPQSSGDGDGAHDAAHSRSIGGLMQIARSPAPPQCATASCLHLVAWRFADEHAHMYISSLATWQLCSRGTQRVCLLFRKLILHVQVGPGRGVG